MPKCPYCGTIATNSIKEWDYSGKRFHVKKILCQHCGISFAAYYNGGKFSHIIPKSPSLVQRIVRYLQIHEEATKEQIATGINERMVEVEAVLKQLQGNSTILKQGVQ